jgi:Cutinase
VSFFVFLPLSNIGNSAYEKEYEADEYLQGGQIFDDAFCGGGDTNEGYTNTAVPLSASAVTMIKAAIFMGDPRYRYGLSYDVGTCTAQGVSNLDFLVV